MRNTQLTIGNERVLVERKLGSGGFSQVFLARSPQSGRQYALKVMGWSDQSDLKKIQHEIDIHRKMSESEYCVRLYESAGAPDSPAGRPSSNSPSAKWRCCLTSAPCP